MGEHHLGRADSKGDQKGRMWPTGVMSPSWKGAWLGPCDVGFRGHFQNFLLDSRGVGLSGAGFKIPGWSWETLACGGGLNPIGPTSLKAK